MLFETLFFKYTSYNSRQLACVILDKIKIVMHKYIR
jgi:hypothetical protein